MKIRTVFFYFLMLIGLNTSAQGIFDHEYIVIPERFDFQEKKHQYQLNSLLRVLFQEEGFTVLMNSEDKPEELAKDPCLALNVEVELLSSLLSSKFQIKLYDCYNKLVYTSKVGKSRSKKHKDGYKEGVREAFRSIQELDRTKSSKAIKSKTTTANVDPSEPKAIARYKKDGELFRLTKKNTDYLLLKADKSIAELIEQADGSLRYEGENIKGVARFTPEGDLVVSYQDEDIGRKVEMTYYKVQE